MFDSWVGKIPWRRERLPTPVFWPGSPGESGLVSRGSQGLRSPLESRRGSLGHLAGHTSSHQKVTATSLIQLLAPPCSPSRLCARNPCILHSTEGWGTGQAGLGPRAEFQGQQGPNSGGSPREGTPGSRHSRGKVRSGKASNSRGQVLGAVGKGGQGSLWLGWEPTRSGLILR